MTWHDILQYTENVRKACSELYYILHQWYHIIFIFIFKIICSCAYSYHVISYHIIPLFIPLYWGLVVCVLLIISYVPCVPPGISRTLWSHHVDIELFASSAQISWRPSGADVARHGVSKNNIWGFPRIGVPPVIIHFSGIFDYKPTSSWGTPIFRKPPYVAFDVKYDGITWDWGILPFQTKLDDKTWD